MAAQQQKSGKPWSGANPIPNIHQLMESLDKDKKERDKQIDAKGKGGDGVVPHQNEKRAPKGKTVTDPVTGNEVVIENVNKEFMKNVDDPKVYTFRLCCLGY